MSQEGKRAAKGGLPADNLDVLRRCVKDESVDLVYLDPPFKSNQGYNVLFAEEGGTGAAAQFKACKDTWEWNLPMMVERFLKLRGFHARN